MGEALIGPPLTASAPAPEAEIVRDMLRRGLPAIPVLIGLAAIGWGWHGAFSAAFAIALVMVNFALTAVVLSVTGRVSVTMLMAGVLAGYVARMALVVIALAVVRHMWWTELVPLAITLVVTHLGLLFWEMRHISASLAFPGIKPVARSARQEASTS